MDYIEFRGGSWPLPVIHVDSRTWRYLKTPSPNIAYNAHNCEQAQISIHVAKFNRLADWVLVRPLLLCNRFADHGYLSSAGVVRFIEFASVQ